MSTAELKDFIDGRTAEERQWMAAYLLDGLTGIPALPQTTAEMDELSRRSTELRVGHARVTQAEAEAHWAALDRQKE
jgi:hypothetical protein